MAVKKKKRRRSQKLHVLPCLLLAAAAVLLWIWPFPARQEPAPFGAEETEETAPVAPAPVQAPGAEPEEQNAPVPVPALFDEDAGKIRVTELMVKNRATLPDEDGDFPDWIELENISDSPVDLSGWRLTDSDRKPGTVLQGAVLAPGERLLLFASGIYFDKKELVQEEIFRQLDAVRRGEISD